MSLKVYHHPFTRAANVVWIVEELGIPYELHYVDILKGAQKSPEVLALNPMGKLPIVTDGDAVVTEAAAIALYLGDRYSLGKLAPTPDDPARAAYLRWSFFAPSVVEPGLLAKSSKWEFKPSQAGWGTYESMVAAMESALAKGPYVLGERFSMADTILGGTIRFMLRFKMLESTPVFAAYSDRLGARPALIRAEEINAKIAKEHGLG